VFIFVLYVSSLRWLRAVGVDAEFFNDRDGGMEDLFATAIREQRVLITKRQAVIDRRHCPSHCYLISQDNRKDNSKVFKEIIEAFGFEVDWSTQFTRCVACNGSMHPWTPSNRAEVLPGCLHAYSTLISFPPPFFFSRQVKNN